MQKGRAGVCCICTSDEVQSAVAGSPSCFERRRSLNPALLQHGGFPLLEGGVPFSDRPRP